MEPELREHAIEIGKGNGRCEGREKDFFFLYKSLFPFYGSLLEL